LLPNSIFVIMKLKFLSAFVWTLFTTIASLQAQRFVGELKHSGLLSLIDEENKTGKTTLLWDESSKLSALILVDTGTLPAVLEQAGAEVRTQAGQVWSVSIPKNNLLEVLSLSCIQVVEPATRSSALRMQLDSSRKILGVDPLHSGFVMQEIFQGEEVVIGIVDIGFQHKHPAFYTSDSSETRIKRVWQQNGSGGVPPQGYSYGVEFKGDKIFEDGDLHGTHGTHVAGIASGSGIGSPNLKYKGVAPAADLVFVSIKYYADTLPGSALSDYLLANPAIIDAYAYIFEYARSVGKPAVINLSWGMHTGPHDGTSLFDLATDALVGPGKILVGAAGNYGQNSMHFTHLLRGDTISTFAIENQRNNLAEEQVYVDIWGSGNSRFSVSVKFNDTLGSTVYQTPFISSAQSGTHTHRSLFENVNLQAFFICTPVYFPNNKPNITLHLQNPLPKSLVMELVFTSSYNEIHAWNSGGVFRYTSGSFVSKVGRLDKTGIVKPGDTDYTVGENGGTSKSVISVGASTAKNWYISIENDTINNTGYSQIGAITPFSSRGPTADGRIKPDIVAPGLDVVAPVYLQQHPGWAWRRLLAKEDFKGDTFGYAAFSGTSMASPHVAGIVALMLQANPRLSPFQIRQILMQTATIDGFTGAVPNNVAGWGKANASLAVVEAARILGSRSNNLQEVAPLFLLYPNPTSDYLYFKPITSTAFSSVKIVDMKGVVVRTIAIENKKEETIIPVFDLSPGVYVIQSGHISHRFIKE